MKKTMELDDRKVLRFFGQRPHLGRRIPVAVSVSKGNMAYPEFFGKQAEEVKPYMTSTVIALRQLRPGLWEVHLNDQTAQASIDWLLYRCQPYASIDKPPRKRRVRKHHRKIVANQMLLK